MGQKDLIKKWRQKNAWHRRCQLERAVETKKHDEEWLMHEEAARVYSECADDLEDWLRKSAAAARAAALPDV